MFLDMFNILTMDRWVPVAEASVRAPSAATSSVQRRQLRGPDKSELGQLLKEHGPAIAQLCHHLVGPVEARDAAQLSFERIVKSIERFDPEKGEFRSWALTVARNVCRDRLRRRKLERGAFVGDATIPLDMAQAHGESPEQTVGARAEVTELNEALQDLPETMRTAVVMFHLQDASYEEIAAALDVPMGTVMTWLHRGRKRLRAALEAKQ